MPTLDTLIARIALSLWTSARRVEPLPTVRVWEPSQVVEIVARHRAVVGETDLFKPELGRAGGVFERFPHGVPAQRRVHVVISRQRHAPSLAGLPGAATLKAGHERPVIQQSRFSAMDGRASVIGCWSVKVTNSKC